MLEKTEQRSRILDMLQKLYPGYHPLTSILTLAQVTKDEKIELDCHKTISKYIEPELKSIEVKGDLKADFGTLTVIMAEQDEKQEEPEPEVPESKKTLDEMVANG